MAGERRFPRPVPCACSRSLQAGAVPVARAQVIAVLAEKFGPGRLSLLGTPGAPAPVRLQELGVARVSYGPFPHRRTLVTLAEEAGALLNAAGCDDV